MVREDIDREIHQLRNQLEYCWERLAAGTSEVEELVRVSQQLDLAIRARMEFTGSPPPGA